MRRAFTNLSSLSPDELGLTRVGGLASAAVIIDWHCFLPGRTSVCLRR